MTEAVTPIDKKEEALRFLDLDENQFGTIVFLSSASAQIQDIVTSEKMKEEMLRLINSDDYTTVGEALMWVRAHRNNIIQMNGASVFALNLLNQVEDLIIDKILNQPTTEETE